MSNYCTLHCDACNASANGSVNRGFTALITLAENSWPLHLLREMDFDLSGIEPYAWNLGYESAQMVEFAGEHAKCNAFRVCGEYSTDKPHFPQVKGVDHCPCRLCADRGVIPCPECKPEQAVRIENDATMRSKARKRG